MADIPFSEENRRRLAVALGLAEGASELQCQAALYLRAGCVSELIAEVDQVMNSEFEYLRTAEVLGWLHD